jgi:hypothetical protein
MSTYSVSIRKDQLDLQRWDVLGRALARLLMNITGKTVKVDAVIRQIRHQGTRLDDKGEIQSYDEEVPFLEFDVAVSEEEIYYD